MSPPTIVKGLEIPFKANDIAQEIEDNQGAAHA